MFTFLDLLRQAQGGQAADTMARAYGLSRAEFDRLSAALLPVFSLGLKTSMADMAAVRSPMELIDGQKFKAAFEDASAAMSPAMTETARILLEKLFGSGAAADTIAAQTAAMTGIGADVVARVMPALAATIFGGLAKEMEAGPFAGAFKAMGFDAANPLGAANPFRDAMSAFLKGYAQGDAPPEAKASPWPPGMESFGRMFDPGVEMAEKNARFFTDLFTGKR